MDDAIRFLETEHLTPDTHVIRLLYGEGINPVAVHLNSMVITGDEPVVVDTSAGRVSEQWFEKVFELVEPEDIRWIFLSHDDHDHTGNLVELLDRAPQATLVGTWFMVERLVSDYDLPLARMRWVNDGESFHAGRRELVAVTPPIFDSPVTRGLWDPTSGVYWAADAFAAPVTHEVRTIDELDPGFYREGFLQFQRLVSPWHLWLDPAKYQPHLDRIRDLGARSVANAHGPALHGGQIASGLELMRELPYLPAAPLPGQAELEAIMAAVTAPAEAATPMAKAA